jgi:hypothetical protein
MKVRLTNGTSAAQSEILDLERGLGRPLPDVLRAFVNEFDGARPEPNTFKICSTNDSGVNDFIPVRRMLAERANIAPCPATMIPVAWAEGGNYVVLDAASGEIWFWDHEQRDSPTQLAADFESFLGMLAPFDPSAVKLKPNQVKRAWIDPEFLRRLSQ